MSSDPIAQGSFRNTGPGEVAYARLSIGLGGAFDRLTGSDGRGELPGTWDAFQFVQAAVLEGEA